MGLVAVLTHRVVRVAEPDVVPELVGARGPAVGPDERPARTWLGLGLGLG